MADDYSAFSPVDDYSAFTPVSQAGPTAAPKPKSDFGNIGRGLAGSYKQAVTNGLLMQPVRWGMEALDVGGYKQKLRDKFPGKPDTWYDQQMDKVYDQAILGARKDAQEQTANNPYPGHQVGNFVAGVLGSADPTMLIAPGVGLSKGAFQGTARQVATNVAKHVGKQAAIQGTIGGATDLATQGMDIAEGLQNDVDVNRLGTSAALGAGFGAGFAGVQTGIHNPKFQEAVANSTAPDFIKGLFLERGHDLNPEAVPFKSQVGEASPAMAPENVARHREVLAKGTADDINNFYDEVGGPRPAPESIDKWLQQREAMWPEGSGAPAVAPKPEIIEAQIHRDNIKAHIDDQTKTWKNKPNVNVIDSLDDMSPEVRASADRDGITPDNTVGFLGEDGQVHIFANQIKTPQAANAVLFHEALGHYGLAQRFGSKLDSTLDTLVARNVGQFGKKVNTWIAKNPGAYGGSKTRAAEEVLAEMSQNGPLPKSIGDAIVAGVRQFARRMGVDLKFGDAEVRHILSMAHDAVINGRGRDVVGNRFQGLHRGADYQSTDFGAEQPNRQMYAGTASQTAPHGGSDEWFTGPDGNLRYEIPDQNARFDEWLSHEDIKNGMDLDTILLHPQLFKAYPELRNVKVIRDVSASGGGPLLQGYFDPVAGKIHISPRAFDPKSTLLHEVQHWIQFKEGFAQGGNSGSIRLDNKEALGKLVSFYERELSRVEHGRLPKSNAFVGVKDVSGTIWDRMKRAKDLIESSGEVKTIYDTIASTERTKMVIDLQVKRYAKEIEDLDVKMQQSLGPEEYDKAFERFVELNKKYSDALNSARKLQKRIEVVSNGLTDIKGKFSDLSYDMYNLLTGEVEARDVQARMHMGEEERARTAPFEMEGINPKDMINYQNNDISAEIGRDPLGRDTTDTDMLGDIDKLKANPRFWTDPEYRQNVIELGRSKAPIEIGGEQSAIPAPSGFKSEAEARAAANRQMTPEQLGAAIESGDVDIDKLERTYENAYTDYVPVQRPDREVFRAAIDAGISPAKVKKIKNIEDLSARIYRSQKAADVLNDRIAGLLEKEGTPAWSIADADKLRQALVDHNYILSKLWDDTSEVGRALRVAKMGYTRSSMEAYKQLLAEHGGSFAGLADDETLNRFARSLKALMAGGANPNGVNALVKGLAKPNWEEYLLSARTNMMLSGMSTHVTAITDMIDGIGLDLMDSAAGLIPSLGREGLRALGIDVKPGIHPAEIAARLWGLVRAGMEASTYVDTLKTLREGSERHTSGGRQYARIPLVSKVGDLIAAEDQFFRAFGTNMHLYGLGVRRAVDEARAAGKKPSFDDLMSTGVSYARYPDRDMLKEAHDATETNLLLAPNMLTTPLDALRRSKQLGPNATIQERTVNAAQRAGSFVANFLLPFVRTATNSLYQRVWRRTPLTMFDPHTLGDLREGGVKADIAMGRIMLGTASVAFAWAAAGRGQVSGEGPTNPYKKAVKMATGWRPNSIKSEVNGQTQYNINQGLGNRLNIFDLNSQTATMVAGLREAFDKGANEGQIATGMKLAVYQTIKSLGDNSWFGDISDTFSTFTDPRSEWKRDPWVANQVTSFVPNLASQVARVRDQSQPLTTVQGDLGQTIENTFKSKIPGLRETLPDRMTPFGEPVQNGGTMAGQTTILPQGNRLTGGAFIKENTDPVVKEVSRLDDMYEESLVTPVQRTVKIGGEKKKLTNEEFSEYQRMAGIEITETIRDMMDTEEWQSMDDESRAAWIKKSQSDAKKRVKEHLYGGGE